MNELYKNGQQEKLSNQSTTEMPIFYSSMRNHALTNKPLINRNDGRNGKYEDDYVVQAVQQWKLQTSDHRNSSNNHNSSSNINTTSNLSNGNLSNHTDKNSNKDELLANVDESDNSITTMKKRTTPLPASHTHRRSNRKNESPNSNLLTPNKKNKLGGTTINKSTKSAPIFIPPKKSSHQSPSFSTIASDDSHQTKSKHILERQTALIDNQISSTMINSTTTSPTRSYTQLPSSSLEDSSGDDSDNESLLIRKKIPKIKDQQFNTSLPTPFYIPPAIFIIDPYGNSHTFDPDSNLQEQNDHNEQILSDDSNTLNPNNVLDISSLPEVEVTSPTTPDKYTLHSIGEEEEEGEVKRDSGNIFSKELNRIEALTRSHQTNLDVENKDNDHINKELLSRRWSDSIADQEEKNSVPKPLLVKTPSAASVMTPTGYSPVKLSKTKYILMKLHLTSSSKDDEANTFPLSTTTNPPKRRTVHRSSDKKRYQTQ